MTYSLRDHMSPKVYDLVIRLLKTGAWMMPDPNRRLLLLWPTRSARRPLKLQREVMLHETEILQAMHAAEVASLTQEERARRHRHQQRRMERQQLRMKHDELRATIRNGLSNASQRS
jgi:hypothetical protein